MLYQRTPLLAQMVQGRPGNPGNLWQHLHHTKEKIRYPKRYILALVIDDASDLAKYFMN
jgi:hypothetical protein